MDGPLEGEPAIIGRSDSFVLLLVFSIFVYITVLDMVRVQQQDALLSEIAGHAGIVAPATVHIPWILILAGLVLLYGGGELTIRSSIVFAEYVGIPTSIVGLFVVALGTSMPELVTCIIAAVRGEPDLALGNVVGSNIFNALVVLPAAGMISKIHVPAGGIGDLAASWVLAAALIPLFFLGRATLGRGMGVTFLAAYLAYAVFRIIAT
jgi:cation:H+ antiporter